MTNSPGSRLNAQWQPSSPRGPTGRGPSLQLPSSCCSLHAGRAAADCSKSCSSTVCLVSHLTMPLIQFAFLYAAHNCALARNGWIRSVEYVSCVIWCKHMSLSGAVISMCALRHLDTDGYVTTCLTPTSVDSINTRTIRTFSEVSSDLPFTARPLALCSSDSEPGFQRL